MRPYEVLASRGDEVAVVASIPHTGTWMPSGLAARLADDAMRGQPMCDWHLHDLYDFLPDLGVTVVHATVSRMVVDLNRSPQPLSLYPGRVETSVVPQTTFWGDTVWAHPPDDVETEALLAAWHRPYHDRLAAELARLQDRNGRVVLLDLHSVAGRANRIHNTLADDIYLGDRDGTSCPTSLTDEVAACYRVGGLCVVRNTPYKGGFITHHYGQQSGIDALQIEMVQRVYMDEAQPEGAVSTPEFAAAKQRLKAVFERLIPAVTPKA